MAGVCYVEHKDICCLVIFVALMIAPNSLSKAVPSLDTQKWDSLSHVLLLDSLFQGKLGSSSPGMGI